MSIEILMQYVTYALMAVGVLAFMVSVITQVIKEMPGLKKIQTNVVALVVSLILCPLAVVILCIYFKIVLFWYYIVGAILAAFIVYLVSTGGWEKVSEMWDRSKYNKKNQLQGANNRPLFVIYIDAEQKEEEYMGAGNETIFDISDVEEEDIDTAHDK